MEISQSRIIASFVSLCFCLNDSHCCLLLVLDRGILLYSNLLGRSIFDFPFLLSINHVLFL